MASKTVLGIVGSPNRDGRTNALVTAALAGAAAADAKTELIQMADHVVAACKDCIPRDCERNLRCRHDDSAFEFLSAKVLDCGALVLGAPVYWWDTTAMVRLFMLKMFRVLARTAPLHGLPAFGIAIAGGTGNGLVSGLRPLYHCFQMLQMRALEPVPATRFNFGWAQDRAHTLGEQLAVMADRRHPFAGLEDRLLWYDALPYLGLSRADERRLLADVTTAALEDEDDPDIARGLVRADMLRAAGQAEPAQAQVTLAYEAGVKLLNARAAAQTAR